MRTLVYVAVLLGIVATAGSSTADPVPAPSSPVVMGCGNNEIDCDAPGDGHFTAGAGSSVPGQSGGNGQAVGLAERVKIYQYAPTCTGNDRGTADAPCGAAINTCQPTGKGLVRYWVWVAEVDAKTGQVLDPPGWVLQPGTACLGPDHPGLPVRAAVGGVVASEFKDLVVVKGVAHVDPHDATLVNFDNGFWTDAKTYVLPSVAILGHQVVVTAKPERFDWYFGDGATAMNAGRGRQGTTDVEHTYTDKGLVRPYVVITWSGTFTVDGGAPLDVIGTATTTGDGTPLQVKEARAELVSR